MEALGASLAESRKMGHVPLQFEARLVLGDTQVRAGQTASGRVDLKALEREAAARAFRLIARRARQTIARR